MKTRREQIIEIFDKHCTLVNKDYHEYIILSKSKFTDAILALEQKPTDQDIENAASDYINKPEQTWKTADYLHIVDAYERGAKDLRDNNIYISPK